MSFIVPSHFIENRHIRSVVSCFVLVFFALVLFAASGSAQGTRGTINGVVRDPNGAAVPNATVKLIDATRGAEVRSVQTNSSGEYQFLEIEPSTYNIVVSSSGFAESTINDVRVEPNRNIKTDVSLTIGEASADVTVTAGVELIDKESPTLGTTVDQRRVVGLPLNGREVLNLALLQPGVAPADGAFGNGLGIRVNGSRGVENNITLDGGNNNEVAVGGSIGAQPRPDAVQEFRLLTSNFEPEFGRNTGAVINVVTKSGTNDYHGNARFFYRPTELSAARFIDKALPPAGSPPGADLRRKFDRKDYGFNIGGPIYFLNFGEGVPMIYDGHDKSYFFVDYERRYQVLGQSQTLPSLPSADERNGIFSTEIIDPLTGNPFPNNTIPQDRISPIARYYLGFLPAASGGQAQVSANQTTKNQWFTMRLDHFITQDHILNFTYNLFDSNVFSPFAFGGSNVPGFGSSDLRTTNNYVGRYTYVITPNLVNTFMINYSTNKQPGVAPVNQTTPEEIGFTSDFVADRTFVGPPNVRLLDRGIIMGNSIQGPQRRFTENIQFQDSFSWVAGDHRMKFGVDWTKYKQDTDFLFVNQGIFSYSAVGLMNVTNTTGDDFADFLIGNSPAAIQFGAAGQRDYRQRAWALFAQDTWNITNNLTVSYGLRYEYNSPLKDKFNRVAFYRPGSYSQLLQQGIPTMEGQMIEIPAGGRAPNGLVYVGDPDNVLGGTVPVGGVEPDKNNFAPRLGLAWSLGSYDNGFMKYLIGENQSVIRLGVGMYYGAVIGDTALQQLSAPGYNGTNFFQFPASGTLANPFLPDPFPTYGGDQGQVPNPFAQSSLFVSAPLGQMSQPIDPLIKTPQTLQFNVTYERAFARDYVVGLSYVGSRSHKLYVREQVNPALGTFLSDTLRTDPPVPAPTTANANSRRLNNDIPLGLTQLTTGGNAQFDSMQVNFQKRYSDDGLLFQLAYTYSRSFNDADSQRGQLDLLDRRAGWALSDDDVPHRFVGSFLYELPFFKKTGGITNRLLDGWSLGAIYTYQSGRLFSVGNPIDIDGTGGALINFADLGTEAFTAMNGVENDRRGFNAGAFAIANCGTDFSLCDGVGRRGTSGRNQFRLDNPVNQWDAILIKKIKLFSETNNLELRFEAFNLLNTTQFTTINTNLSSSNFGIFTDTRESRSIQLGARLNF